jgi:hypothetical protein
MVANRLREVLVVAASVGAAAWLGLTPLTASAAPTLPSPPTARPDLKIEYTGDRNGRTGRDFQFAVRVTNLGAPTAINQDIVVAGNFEPGFQIVSLSGPDGAECEFRNDGQDNGKPRAAWVCVLKRAMLTNSSTRISATVTAPATRGFYQMNSAVDPFDSIREVSEGNNVDLAAINVQP